MKFESARLKTAVEEVSDVPVIKVSGEIDVHTAPNFKTALNKAINSGATDLIVDLSDVSYMDSGGFGALLGAVKRVKPEGGSINLVGCSEAIERMLKITRLDTIFGVQCKLEDAITSLKSVGCG